MSLRTVVAKYYVPYAAVNNVVPRSFVDILHLVLPFGFVGTERTGGRKGVANVEGRAGAGQRGSSRSDDLHVSFLF